jgi:hypothetical protein
VLHYDVRRNDTSTQPVLLLIGSPMGAMGAGGPQRWPNGSERSPSPPPGGHDGFLGGEYGGMGEPDAFAATLRKVLTN